MQPRTARSYLLAAGVLLLVGNSLCAVGGWQMTGGGGLESLTWMVPGAFLLVVGALVSLAAMGASAAANLRTPAPMFLVTALALLVSAIFATRMARPGALLAGVWVAGAVMGLLAAVASREAA